MQKISTHYAIHKWWRYIIIISIALLTITGGYYYTHYQSDPIYTYQEKRDLHEIMDIFKDDAYWLYSSPDYSPLFAFKTKSPNKDVAYLGKMQIRVLRINGKLMGFVTYYMMKDGTTAHILFLGVHKDHRRKGYGLQLMRRAIEEIKQLGAKQIKILTRIENIKAQNMYRGLGFLDDYIDPRGFIYFKYPL